MSHRVETTTSVGVWVAYRRSGLLGARISGPDARVPVASAAGYPRVVSRSPVLSGGSEGAT